MEAKTLMLVAVILATSGCLNDYQGDENDLPNRGLEIESFSITDSELRPEQEAVIIAEFNNYHEEIDIQTIELNNYGELLEVEENGCTPEISELKGAREGITPNMICRWRVKAPTSEQIEGFSERTEPIQLRAVYRASIENQEPLTLDFSPVDEIESSKTRSLSSSNGEVSIELNTDNPIATDSGGELEVSADNDGRGRLPEGFNFYFEPESIFGNQCDNGKTQEGIQSDQVTFICSLNAENSGTRNIFVSADYKYVKEPILDVTIVKNR